MPSSPATPSANAGRHRGRRAPSATRRIATRASAAGATLALPVIGATATSAFAEESTYTVQSGDTLSTIAMEQDVEGGWTALYEANKSVIGDDPNLISPGEELTLDTASADSGTSTQTTTTTQVSTEPSAVMPVSGGTPTAGYEASGSNWSTGVHTGQDWSVPVGTTVKAAVDGKVVKAGWDGSFGYEVMIEHADGDYSMYAHLSQIDVSVGQTVDAGDRIALSGATGNVTGPHLHFEVRTTPEWGTAIDPVAWLRGYGVDV
ncbi:peptidoglycan DD-metalloendopeptidase family protein [Streptomyces sp. NPDC051940]|uniref:M23 family metallopeptidase n=1 Tax=Streptomyces sp. NPDC051940 TaxID=3155675 RepID=UPI00342C19AC